MSDSHHPTRQWLPFISATPIAIIAKDAVVGKAVQRPNQAYGYELVIQGFVVLAPDAINCGERNIPEIRHPYENKHCHQILNEPLGRPFWFKHAYDGMRAVDVLSALDFVDSERIGVIGHSMGSAQAASTMARDPRVKVGLVTGRVTKKNLLAIAPRYLMTVLQSLEKTPETIAQNSRVLRRSHTGILRTGRVVRSFVSYRSEMRAQFPR